MTVFTTKQAQRRFYDLLDAARRAPVVIACHGRPRAVVVSAQDWRLYEGLARVQAAARAASLLDRASVLIEAGQVHEGEQHRQSARGYTRIATAPPVAPKRRLTRRRQNGTMSAGPCMAANRQIDPQSGAAQPKPRP